MHRILFVDDEPKVLAGLRRTLHRLRDDWDMRFVGGGEEALAALNEAPYDVIVTDMRMPQMDGAQLLERIQARHPAALRLVLSGHSDQELTLRSVGAAHQYLSKPCDFDQLKLAIERGFAVQQEAGSEGVRRLAAQITSLPSLPDVYFELVAEMENPDAPVDRIGDIISRDVAMSARLMQLVNSSFFGLPVRVDCVRQAVVLLGLSVIRALALAQCVFRRYEGRSLGAFSLPAFSDHSLTVAMLARDLANCEGAPPDVVGDALLAGLLHDVGQVVLAEQLTAEYTAVCERARAGEGPLDGLELEALGATHAGLGGYLLNLWGLPTPVVEAVALHHHPERAPTTSFQPLTAVHAAECFVAADNEGVPEGPTLNEGLLAELGLGDRAEVWRARWESPAGKHAR